jgi:hypothetical protein
MKTSIFSIAILFSLFSVILTSCEKDEEVEKEVIKTSFAMKYDGVKFTEANTESLVLYGDSIAIAGNGTQTFGLIIEGIGADNSTATYSIIPRRTDPTVILDFGAIMDNDGLVASLGIIKRIEKFIATSGTIKRTGNQIDIDVTGSTTSGETKSLVATIVVGQVK